MTEPDIVFEVSGWMVALVALVITAASLGSVLVVAWLDRRKEGREPPANLPRPTMQMHREVARSRRPTARDSSTDSGSLYILLSGGDSGGDCGGGDGGGGGE